MQSVPPEVVGDGMPREIGAGGDWLETGHDARLLGEPFASCGLCLGKG